MIIVDVKMKTHVKTVAEPQNTTAIGTTGVKMRITKKIRPQITKNEIVTTKVATII